MDNYTQNRTLPTKKIGTKLSEPKNRRGISTVLTTMIILVASVVLGTGVVVYGSSMFEAGAASESLAVTNTQVWVDKSQNSGWAWGAADIRNDGDKQLAVDHILVRGTSIPISNWYADTNPNRVTSANFQSALNYTSISNINTGALANATGVSVPVGCTASPGPIVVQLGTVSQKPTLCLTNQNGPLTLAPSAKAIIYFKVPQNLLTSLDAGSAGSVAIYAGKVGEPITVPISAK